MLRNSFHYRHTVNHRAGQFAGEQVLCYTDREKDLITCGLKMIGMIFDGNDWNCRRRIPSFFIKTGMAEGNDVCGYTHGKQIYLLFLMTRCPNPETVESCNGALSGK